MVLVTAAGPETAGLDLIDRLSVTAARKGAQA
jgi:hypothetical protein